MISRAEMKKSLLRPTSQRTQRAVVQVPQPKRDERPSVINNLEGGTNEPSFH